MLQKNRVQTANIRKRISLEQDQFNKCIVFKKNNNQEYSREEVTEIIELNNYQQDREELSRSFLRHLREQSPEEKQQQLQGVESQVNLIGDRIDLQNEIVFRHRMVEQMLVAIDSARESQDELRNSIIQQRSDFNSFFTAAMHQLQQKLNNIMKISKDQKLQWQKNSNSQRLQEESLKLMQRRWQIEKKLIKQQLQQRYLYKIQKLQKELQQRYRIQHQLVHGSRKYSAENYSENSKSQMQESISQMQNLMTQMKKTSEEIAALQGEIDEKDQIINQLEIENQRLNEHIFDIEQRIEGIELEVEEKVRQRLSNLQNQNNFKTPQPQLNHSKQLQQLISLNQQLSQQLNYVQQQKDNIQSQLKENQTIAAFREEQIKRNEEDINLQWMEIEKSKNQLNLREQELTIAEQNISHKISQIRLKQSELQKWQNQILQKQIQLKATEQQIKTKSQLLTQLQNKFLREKSAFEIIQKQSLVKIHQNIYNRKNLKDSRTDEQISISSQRDRYQQPNREGNIIGLKQRRLRQEQEKRQQKSIQYSYQYRSKVEMPTTVGQRNYDENQKSYHRVNNRQKQRSSINSNGIRQPRLSHQFVLPVNISSKYQQPNRSSSKGSEKNHVRNNLNVNTPNNGYKNTSFRGNNRGEEFYQTKQGTGLDGLGSKLQRLKEQIKRQIDSIK